MEWAPEVEDSDLDPSVKQRMWEGNLEFLIKQLFVQDFFIF